MKTNRSIIILVAAGIIVAGATAAVLFTDRGQQYSRKLGKQGKKLLGKADHLAGDIKEGIANLQEALKVDRKKVVPAEA